MDIDQEFLNAQAESKDLPERPNNATLLKLYALFKQGSSGNASGERPGATDFVARAKWDAWQQLSGTSTEDAKRQYVDLIEELKDA